MRISQFPGEQASLTVAAGVGDYGITVFKFYNQIARPSSYINRVEVWKEPGRGTTLVALYFNCLGCREMQEFAKNSSATMYHYHENNWCKLQVIDPEGMEVLLRILLVTQSFIGAAQSVMKHNLNSIGQLHVT